MSNYQGIYHQIMTAIEDHPNVELTLGGIAELAELTTVQAANGLSRIMLQGLMPQLTRTSRGIYVYAVDIEVDKWVPTGEKALALIRKSPTKSLTLQELAKELDCHENYVHVAIERANKLTCGTRIKRQVRYAID